jgi:hypothetical protein
MPSVSVMHYSLDQCEVPASAFKSFGLVAVVGMIVTLQVQCYWGPLVFGHDEIDNAVAFCVLRYL